jgi:hypothetical protein
MINRVSVMVTRLRCDLTPSGMALLGSRQSGFDSRARHFFQHSNSTLYPLRIPFYPCKENFEISIDISAFLADLGSPEYGILSGHRIFKILIL